MSRRSLTARPFRTPFIRRLPLPLFVIGMVVALPVLIPAGMLFHTLDRRRLLKAASARPCPACGAVLGAEAVAEADRRNRERDEARRGCGKGIILRIAPSADAICLRCGAEFMFRDRSFVAVPEPAPPTPAAPALCGSWEKAGDDEPSPPAAHDHPFRSTL